MEGWWIEEGQRRGAGGRKDRVGGVVTLNAGKRRVSSSGLISTRAVVVVVVAVAVVW